MKRQAQMNCVNPRMPSYFQVVNQSRSLYESQLMNKPIMMPQSRVVSQQSLGLKPQFMNQTPIMLRGRKVLSPPHPCMDFKKKFQNYLKPSFVNLKRSKLGHRNWNGMKVIDNEELRKIEKFVPGSFVNTPSKIGGYKLPIQSRTQLKSRKFHQRRKINDRFAPSAPRNTTSFIIRSKKAGGIASFVSPSPLTPAVLPTPIYSQSKETFGDSAKEEWGVDGYGSMKGLIRLREYENREEMHDVEEEKEAGGGGGSRMIEVDEGLEMERRLEHDLNRFEMIYPNLGAENNNVLENMVDDQDSRIAELKDENLTLKEKLFLMEREAVDIRRKLQFLEKQNCSFEGGNEEVVENQSENESDGWSNAPAKM